MNNLFVDEYGLKGFPYDNVGIPERYRDNFKNLETIQPGLESLPCKFITENMSELFQGNMLILGGTIGSGKSFAGYLGVIIYVIKYCYEAQYPGDVWLEEERRYVRAQPYHEYRGEKKRGLVSNAHDILNAAFSDNKDRFAKFQGILLIDDFGREHFTDKGFGISEWDYLFEQRYANMYPTIITTNLTVKELVEKYNKRIYDRLKECAKWEQFTGESMRKNQRETQEK